jgi:hypothetical protein
MRRQRREWDGGGRRQAKTNGTGKGSRGNNGETPSVMGEEDAGEADDRRGGPDRGDKAMAGRRFGDVCQVWRGDAAVRAHHSVG